jgi:methionyl-tRNA synthetase
MEFVMADALARYIRDHKTPTIFATGADEHGGKIAEKAREQNLTPQQFVDKTVVPFEELLKMLNISNDRFVRTTNPEHERRAQIIWQNLRQYIYKGTYSGWYCTGHEEYFPEAIVKANKGTCPEHNRPYEQLKEENYFFKSSAFVPAITMAIETDSFRIIPTSRKNEILSVLKSGLADTSVSRPKDKIAWGIPVPGDDSQVMYVWFEALMNYITVLGYPDRDDFKNFWPANVQVVGKDILRFHAAIWPAMLLALKLPLPKVLYVHGFITVSNQKMSKTLGNVVAPKDVIDKYGVDAFRYFFLRHIPSYDDGDFTWERIEAAYNNELADQLGNAVQRTAAMVTKYQNGVIGDIKTPEHDLAPFERALEDCRFDRALDEIWEHVRGLNQYIEETKPWEIAKVKDEEHLREVLSYLVASLLEIAELLAPFMPDTTVKIREIFASGVLKAPSAPLFPKREEPKAAAV